MKAVPFAAREARRLQAWKLHQQGWSQRAIADLLEVSAAAVSRWFKRVRLAGSVKALHRHQAPGATQRLPRARWRESRALLRRGAEVHGFHGALWTRERVAVLIRRHFAVTYSPRHVGRLLAAMNWSVQKPLRRARQRDEAKIARWRTERWPTLQAKPKSWARACSSWMRAAFILCPPWYAPTRRAARPRSCVSGARVTIFP